VDDVPVRGFVWGAFMSRFIRYVCDHIPTASESRSPLKISQFPKNSAVMIGTHDIFCSWHGLLFGNQAILTDLKRHTRHEIRSDMDQFSHIKLESKSQMTLHYERPAIADSCCHRSHTTANLGRQRLFLVVKISHNFLAESITETIRYIPVWGQTWS